MIKEIRKVEGQGLIGTRHKKKKFNVWGQFILHIWVCRE